MPSYKVLTAGFHDCKMYHPTGKRPVLHCDKAFKKCPSWLSPIKKESKKQRDERLAAEAEAEKKQGEKRVEDKKDIDSVTFTQIPASTQVETL